MFSDDTKKILGDIIKGVVFERESNHLTAARNFLCTGFTTNTKVTKDFEGQSAIKKEQAEC